MVTHTPQNAPHPAGCRCAGHAVVAHAGVEAAALHAWSWVDGKPRVRVLDAWPHPVDPPEQGWDPLVDWVVEHGVPTDRFTAVAAPPAPGNTLLVMPLGQDSCLHGAWLVLLRDGVALPRALRQEAAAVAPQFLERLERARRALPGQPASLVVGGGATVECATLGGAAWLEVPGFLEDVRDAQRAGMHLGTRTGAALRVVEMLGVGRQRYLVHAHAPPGVPQGVLAVLSPAQRQVAVAAAAGATLHQVAQGQGIALETARSHLREVYRRLDVATRLELARLLMAAR